MRGRDLLRLHDPLLRIDHGLFRRISAGLGPCPRLSRLGGCALGIPLAVRRFAQSGIGQGQLVSRCLTAHGCRVNRIDQLRAFGGDLLGGSGRLLQFRFGRLFALCQFCAALVGRLQTVLPTRHFFGDFLTAA